MNASCRTPLNEKILLLNPVNLRGDYQPAGGLPYEYRLGCGFKKISAFAKTAEEAIKIKADFMDQYMYLFTPEFIASQDAICAEEKRQESLRLLQEKSKESIWRDLYISLLILLVMILCIFWYIHQFR